MCLYARTNKVGSECSTDLGVTESEWEAMTEEERDDLVKEFLGDIFECWVKPAND